MPIKKSSSISRKADPRGSTDCCPINWKKEGVKLFIIINGLWSVCLPFMKEGLSFLSRKYEWTAPGRARSRCDFTCRKRNGDETSQAVRNRPEQAENRQKTGAGGFNKRTLCFRQDKARPVKGFVITNHEYIAVRLKITLKSRNELELSNFTRQTWGHFRTWIWTIVPNVWRIVASTLYRENDWAGI